MSLSFSRSDITQTAQAERGTMCVLPLGKGKRQNKLALGDVDGVVRVVGCKRDERNVVFKLECGNGAPITSLSCGVAAPQVDKLFASAGNTIRGINRKGKEFFKFTTSLQDVIKALHVDNYNIYAASEYVANMVRARVLHLGSTVLVPPRVNHHPRRDQTKPTGRSHVTKITPRGITLTDRSRRAAAAPPPRST